MDRRKAVLWWQKWRWYERNTLPWNRARLHVEFLRREAFVRMPVHGNLLECFQDGRLEIGAGTLLEPGVWITAPDDARVVIGEGCFLNLGVMVASTALVEIGSHCMLANGCFVTDGNHRFDDRARPVTWQGFTSKGPTRVGDNVWCGANVVVTSGVTIGDRCVIGANSVVTRDLPPGTVAAGAPARALRHRRQLGGHRRHPRRLHRRGLARPGAQGDHLGGQPARQRVVSITEPRRRRAAHRARCPSTSRR